MKYIIDDKVFELFPDLRIGIVVGKGLTIERFNPKLNEQIKENTELLLNEFSGKALLDHPNIFGWREIYRKFGVKAKKHKPTAEALLKRVLAGEDFPIVNTAVNAYLAVELLYYLPIGGYDLSKIEGDVFVKVPIPILRKSIFNLEECTK